MAVLDIRYRPARTRPIWRTGVRCWSGSPSWSPRCDAARAGGGEKYVTRHHARGKLLPRERIELLVDQDAPFLELSPVAAWGTDFPVGASVVTGIGVVEGVECVIIANDPTVRGGAVNPYSLKKTQRAGEIALANRLPLINLVESGGADLPTQAEIFIPGGRVFRDLTRLSAAGHPDRLRGLRQRDGRRRVRAGHVRLHDHDPRPGQGVPRRAAAGADGDRRDHRRRVARRRRHARRRPPASPTSSPRTSATASGWPASAYAGSTGASRAPAPRTPLAAPPKYDAEDLLAHRQRRPAGAVRPARGARPGPRRQRVRRVQAGVRHRAGHRLG